MRLACCRSPSPPAACTVLLALRSHGTHQGGTWGTIGGAIEPGETPWEAAVREADEEAAGLDLAEDQTAEGHRYGCVSGWAYVTFPVRVPPASPVTIRSNWETSDLRWIPVDEVGSYPLHPALAESWPELRKLVEDQALLCIAQTVRTSERTAALRGWLQMAVSNSSVSTRSITRGLGPTKSV